MQYFLVTEYLRVLRVVLTCIVCLGKGSIY